MPSFAVKGIDNLSAEDIEPPNAFNLLGFNSNGSAIFGAHRKNHFQNRTCLVRLYRICILSQSAHEIGRISVFAMHPAMVFDGEEEICILTRNLVTPGQLNSEFNLHLVIFNVKTGTLKRYQRKFGIDARFLMKISKGVIFLGGFKWNDYSSVIFRVSALDEINETFDLCEVGKLPKYHYPIYGGFVPALGYGIELVEDGVVVKWDQPGQMNFCKFNCDQWEKLEFNVNAQNTKLFELLRTSYDGGNYRLEFGRCLSFMPFVYVYVYAFRVIKVKGQKPWDVVYSGRVPYATTKAEFYRHIDNHQYYPNGHRMAFFAIENSTMLVSIVQGQPSSLLELCIGLLWPHVGRLNPELTDHEICRLLNVSKFVDVEKYFGNVY